MGWWSLDGWPEARMGDGAADIAGGALAAFVAARGRAGKPGARYEDLLSALALAVAASAKSSIALQPHCTLQGLAASFQDGTEIRVMCEGAMASPDELKPLRAMLKALHSEYKSSELGRKPKMPEVLGSVAFVLRPLPNDYLAPDETRTLFEIRALWLDQRGALPEDIVLAALAVTLRRNAAKLGELVESGETMNLSDLIATIEGRPDLRVPCSTTKGDSFVADELSEILKSAAAFYRGRSSRLPTIDELMAEVTRALRSRPERYDIARLTSLRVGFTLSSSGDRPGGEAPRAAVRVSHPKFGEGSVVRVIEDSEHKERKLEIQFDQGGRKTLLARFVETLNEPQTPARTQV